MFVCLTVRTMAQHNAGQMDDIGNHSATESEQCKYTSAFKRREPLQFSPKRQYALVVVSPLQKPDSCETVFAGYRTPEMPSSAHPNNSLQENPRRAHGNRAGQRPLTRFKPFSFDMRDAVRRVEREQRLQELRLALEIRYTAFKAHPVRRYKPLMQPATQSKARLQPPK